MTPEGLVKQQVKELLDYLGAYYFMPVPMGVGRKTIDFLCCVDGIFIGIETKRPGKKATTALQQLEMKKIIASGGVAFRADSVFEVIHQLRLQSPTWKIHPQLNGVEESSAIIRWSNQNERAEKRRKNLP